MKSDQVNEIAAALAKAQADIKNAAYNRTNPHFRSKYADLATVRDAVTPSLSKHGLSYSQLSSLVTGGDGLPLYVVWTTLLMHSSGQWLSSEYPIPYTPDKPQLMGSNTTYARRYTLSAIIGIASEEDDDANIAQDGAEKADEKAKKPIRFDQKQSAEVTEEMLAQIEACPDEASLDDYARINAGVYGRLMPSHQETLRASTHARRKALRQKADA